MLRNRVVQKKKTVDLKFKISGNYPNQPITINHSRGATILENMEEHYNKPLVEISAFRSAMPDEASQVIRYAIEPQIPEGNKKKPWVWMQKLRTHYTGSIGSTLMTDRFKFWHSAQNMHEPAQDWEVKVRQAGNLCEYGAITDQMCRDKFVFGLDQLIVDTSKSIDEQVHWTNFKKRHSEMCLKREPNTCHWCGSIQGPHTWSVCPAKGRTCTR